MAINYKDEDALFLDTWTKEQSTLYFIWLFNFDWSMLMESRNDLGL